jgi:hypothetical protein
MDTQRDILARDAPDIRPAGLSGLFDIRPDIGFDLPDIWPDTKNSLIYG